MAAGSTSMPASFWTGALRRQAALIVATVLMCAGAGLAYSYYRGAEYTSTASILIDPLEGNPYNPEGSNDQLVNLQTEAELVATDPVARLASRKLGTVLDEVELREQLLVEVPTNTQVLEISFTAGDRERARTGAQAFAEAYLAYRKSRAKTVFDADLGRLQRQQAAVRTKLKQTRAELDATSLPDTERNYLEDRVSSLSAKLAGLESQQSTLEVTDLRAGQQITPAELPPAAGVTNLLLYGGGGGFAGLILGLLIAIARARADDRIHSPDDVELLGLPVLGTAEPRFGARHGATGARTGASSAASRTPELPESYRALRTALVTSAGNPPVSAAILAASKSVTTAPEAAGIAVGLARAGFRVAVIDTLGETAWLLGGRGRLRGLGELLVEGAELRRLLVQPEERLIVLPLGRAHAHTMDRLLSPQMRRTVDELVSQSDYVLLAGGPATGSDGRALASLAGTAVLVANRHVTTRARLIESVEAVRRVDAELVGGVVVDAGPQTGATGRAARRVGRFLSGPFGGQRRRGVPTYDDYDSIPDFDSYDEVDGPLDRPDLPDEPVAYPSPPPTARSGPPLGGAHSGAVPPTNPRR